MSEDTKKPSQIIKHYRGFVIAKGAMGHRFHYFRVDSPADYGFTQEVSLAERAIDLYWAERHGRIQDQELSEAFGIDPDHMERMDAPRFFDRAKSDFKLLFHMEALTQLLEGTSRDLRKIMEASVTKREDRVALDISALSCLTHAIACWNGVGRHVNTLGDILDRRPNPSQKD